MSDIVFMGDDGEVARYRASEDLPEQAIGPEVQPGETLNAGETYFAVTGPPEAGQNARIHRAVPISIEVTDQDGNRHRLEVGDMRIVPSSNQQNYSVYAEGQPAPPGTFRAAVENLSVAFNVQAEGVVNALSGIMSSMNEAVDVMARLADFSAPNEDQLRQFAHDVREAAMNIETREAVAWNTAGSYAGVYIKERDGHVHIGTHNNVGSLNWRQTTMLLHEDERNHPIPRANVRRVCGAQQAEGRTCVRNIQSPQTGRCALHGGGSVNAASRSGLREWHHTVHICPNGDGRPERVNGFMFPQDMPLDIASMFTARGDYEFQPIYYSSRDTTGSYVTYWIPDERFWYRPARGIEEMVEIFNDGRQRQVAYYSIGGITVSTTFLVINHAFHSHDGAPVLFETMVFVDPEARLPADVPFRDYQNRASTVEAAYHQHNEALAMVMEWLTLHGPGIDLSGPELELPQDGPLDIPRSRHAYDIESEEE